MTSPTSTDTLIAEIKRRQKLNTYYGPMSEENHVWNLAVDTMACEAMDAVRALAEREAV